MHQQAYITHILLKRYKCSQVFFRIQKIYQKYNIMYKVSIAEYFTIFPCNLQIFAVLKLINWKSSLYSFFENVKKKERYICIQTANQSKFHQRNSLNILQFYVPGLISINYKQNIYKHYKHIINKQRYFYNIIIIM